MSFIDGTKLATFRRDVDYDIDAVDDRCVLYLPLYKLPGESLFLSRDSQRHTCANYGSTWSPQGRHFDGVDDYFHAGRRASLLITGDMTLEVWQNTRNYNDAQVPLGQSGTFGWIGVYAYYIGGLIGRITFYRGNGVAEAGVGGNAAIGIGWSHLAVTMAGTTVNIYINGVLDKTGALVTTIADAGTNIRIGYRQDNQYPFTGTLGEIRIYDRALPAGEVRRNYLATEWRYK